MPLRSVASGGESLGDQMLEWYLFLLFFKLFFVVFYRFLLV